MKSLRFAAPLLFAFAALAPSAVRADDLPVLHFSRSAWPAQTEGTIASGTSLRIDYDAERLPWCRQLNRNTAWEIAMHYRFDDGPIADLVVADPGMVLSRDSIDIPSGAHKLTLWFENFAAENGDRDIVCQAWDSVYGQNYNFTIE